MPFEKRSIFTEVVLDVLETFKPLLKDAQKSKVAPFMQERTTRARIRDWLRSPNTTPEQRREWVKQVGMEKAMEIIRNPSDRRKEE